MQIESEGRKWVRRKGRIKKKTKPEDTYKKTQSTWYPKHLLATFTGICLTVKEVLMNGMNIAA